MNIERWFEVFGYEEEKEKEKEKMSRRVLLAVESFYTINVYISLFFLYIFILSSNFFSSVSRFPLVFPVHTIYIAFARCLTLCYNMGAISSIIKETRRERRKKMEEKNESNQKCRRTLLCNKVFFI